MKSRMFFRNWWTYQSYHKNPRRKSLRKPPPAYIGVQVSLQSDPDYRVLQPHDRGLLLDLLLLAAHDGGHITADVSQLCRTLGYDHIDLSNFEEWIVNCDGKCYHMPEGFDSKGFRCSTPSPRRRHADTNDDTHAKATTARSDRDKVKVKGKVKGKKTVPSSGSPTSQDVDGTGPPDDVENPPDPVRPDPGQPLPENRSDGDPDGDDPLDQVLRTFGEAMGFEPSGRDRRKARELLDAGHTVQQIQAAITLGLERARTAGSEPDSLAYFATVLPDVVQGGDGYADYVARRAERRGREQPAPRRSRPPDGLRPVGEVAGEKGLDFEQRLEAVARAVEERRGR